MTVYSEPAPPSVIIDHTAYPAIVEEVFAHVLATASVRDLLSLRATSRHLKTRVDNELFSHVVLAESAARPAEASTFLCRLTALWPWSTAQTARGACVAQSSAPHEAIFRVRQSGPLQPSTAKSVRVLDLKTTLPDYGHLPQLEVVRHRLPLEAPTWSMGIKHSPPPRPPPADVYVVHTTLEAVPESNGGWWRNRGLPIAERTRRVVAHVEWDPRVRNNVLTPYASGIPSSVTEFVVVLHPNPRSLADAGDDAQIQLQPDLDSDSETRSSMRRFTAPFIVSLAEFGAALGAATTIVGAEECTAWALDLTHLAANMTGPDLVHALHRYFQALYPFETVQLATKDPWLTTVQPEESDPLL